MFSLAGQGKRTKACSSSGKGWCPQRPAPTHSCPERWCTHASHPLETKSLRCFILSARKTLYLWIEQHASMTYSEASNTDAERTPNSGPGSRDSALAGGSWHACKAAHTYLPSASTLLPPEARAQPAGSSEQCWSLMPFLLMIIVALTTIGTNRTKRGTCTVIKCLHIGFSVLISMLQFLLFIALDHLQAGLGTKLSVKQGIKAVPECTGTNERQWLTLDPGSTELSPHTVPTLLSSSVVPNSSNLFPWPWVSGEVMRQGNLLEQLWELGNLVHICWLWSINNPPRIQRSYKELKAKFTTILHSSKFHRAPTLCKAPTICQLLCVW